MNERPGQGRVGIFHQQDQLRGGCGNAAPGQWRRDIIAQPFGNSPPGSNGEARAIFGACFLSGMQSPRVSGSVSPDSDAINDQNLEDGQSWEERERTGGKDR